MCVSPSHPVLLKKKKRLNTQHTRPSTPNPNTKKTDDHDPTGLDPRSITPKKLGFGGPSAAAAASAAASSSLLFGGGAGATASSSSSLFGGGAGEKAGGGGGGVQASALLSRERDQLAAPSPATASSPGTFSVVWIMGEGKGEML